MAIDFVLFPRKLNSVSARDFYFAGLVKSAADTDSLSGMDFMDEVPEAPEIADVG